MNLNLLGIIITILAGIALFAGLILNTFHFDSIECDKTCILCCDYMQCSDTYYSEADNLCHLSLCENSLMPFQNKSQCTYNPK